LITPPLHSTPLSLWIYYCHNLVNPLQCGTCFDIPLYYHLGSTKNPPNHLCTTYIACSFHHWLHSRISFQTCHYYNLHSTLDNGMYWLHSTLPPPTTKLPWPHLDHLHLHHKFIPKSLWTSHCGMDMGNPIYFTLRLRFEPILYKLTYAHSSYACTRHELQTSP
jgi:hypothetical protein